MKKNLNISKAKEIKHICSKSAFTLAEMMVVMLVLAIILAASIPLVTKKSKLDDAHIWRYVPTDRTHVYYGVKDQNSAMVGTKVPPSSATYLQAYNSMFYINTPGADTSSNPQLAYGVAGTPVAIHYVTNTGAIAEGYNITGLGSAAVALGQTVSAEGENAVAIGNSAKASGGQSVAFGNAAASASNAIAVGDSASATNNNTTAVGVHSQATGECGLALGAYAHATNTESVAIGYDVVASGANSTVVGLHSKAESLASIAIGYGSLADNTAYGTGVADQGYSNVALGYQASAIGAYSTALGDHAQATGSSYNIAVGAGSGNTTASGMYATAIGPSSADGEQTAATGLSSTALGYGARAEGEYSTALGYGAVANKLNSTAVGTGTVTQFANSIQLGPESGKYGTANCIVYIPGKLYIKSPKYSTPAYFYESSDGLVSTIRREGLDSTVLSDRRVKNIIEMYKSSLAQIRELKVYKYHFNEDEMVTRYKKALMRDIDNPSCPDKRPAQFKKCVDKLGEEYRIIGRKKGLFSEEHVGVMAQDLEKVFPGSVTLDKDGYKNINTNEIFYTLVNAIKELDSKVTEIADSLNKIKTGDYGKDFQQKLNVLKTHLYVLNNDINELKRSVVYKVDLDKQITSLDKKYTDRFTYLNDKNNDLKNRLTALCKELKTSRNEIKALKKENNDLRKRIERLEQKIK